MPAPQKPSTERSPTHAASSLTSPQPATATATATATTTHQSSSSSVLSPTTANQPRDPQEAVRHTLEARTAFTASLHSVGQTVSADLRARAVDLHENAAVIQKQENVLAKHTAELSKQNDQWDKVVDTARQGLKEIGDVQNWAEMIERDLLVVEEVLRLVEGEEGHEGEDDRVRREEEGYHEEQLRDGLHEEEDGDLTERENGDRKKVTQEPVDVLDDVLSSASGITGTSATSGAISESSGKISPRDQDGGQQQIKTIGDTKKSAGGWWKWWCAKLSIIVIWSIIY
ncbi:conserved hypothetical protein [Talaromyces stipitatus ATCC 10500]|uniref:Biogenesis of lysosome-related organelles complex 1 subunit 1 n=1 Tax=Talaromyces stipitatus (strain ATCC 10500 / CBS 375.48 / QM 6759 / NRRL 1006) TaxID=441959 RepID=B8MRP0_TALSN|nr:uncharacterized protein TSTA_056940 [Talaromyces stipitatus ATCC 10500]EED13197.1 conserved hypothetical protein [Talaromyces stipitatus ATCC 10500]